MRMPMNRSLVPRKNIGPMVTSSTHPDGLRLLAQFGHTAAKDGLIVVRVLKVGTQGGEVVVDLPRRLLTRRLHAKGVPARRRVSERTEEALNWSERAAVAGNPTSRVVVTEMRALLGLHMPAPLRP